MPLKALRLLVAGVVSSGVSAFAAANASPDSLKAAAHGLFHIGAAINTAQILEQDAKGVALIEQQFDTITPENVLKWEKVHPSAGKYDFELPDKYVAFGTKRGLFVIGHTLMWHSQTPAWVFEGKDGKPASKEELTQRLREHIRTVVGRYRGKVKGWDVVNEAIKDEDGTLRLEKPWYRILGVEGIYTAFEAAHEADPDAELYYNDYSLDNPVKRAGVIKLVQGIRSRGLRIDGVGSQEHCRLEGPKVEAVDATMEELGAAGFKVMVTELDVTMLPRPNRYSGAEVSKTFESAPELNPYKDNLPAEQQTQLAKRYAELFGVYTKHAKTITRVTFWGVTDAGSWLNGWPIRGRTDYPLLFSRDYTPKPAYEAVKSVLAGATPH